MFSSVFSEEKSHQNGYPLLIAYTQCAPEQSVYMEQSRELGYRKAGLVPHMHECTFENSGHLASPVFSNGLWRAVKLHSSWHYFDSTAFPDLPSLLRHLLIAPILETFSQGSGESEYRCLPALW